jgi:hypothetical protein
MWLGHSDPKVTQRHAHLSTKSLQDPANSASILIQRGMPVAKAAVPAAGAAIGVGMVTLIELLGCRAWERFLEAVD